MSNFLGVLMSFISFSIVIFIGLATICLAIKGGWLLLAIPVGLITISVIVSIWLDILD